MFWLTPIHQSNIGFKPAPICFLWYLTIIKRQLWYPFVSKLFFAPHAFFHMCRGSWKFWECQIPFLYFQTIFTRSSIYDGGQFGLQEWIFINSHLLFINVHNNWFYAALKIYHLTKFQTFCPHFILRWLFLFW